MRDGYDFSDYLRANWDEITPEVAQAFVEAHSTPCDLTFTLTPMTEMDARAIDRSYDTN